MPPPRSNRAPPASTWTRARRILPQVNKGARLGYPGFLHGWSALSDAERWAIMVSSQRCAVTGAARDGAPDAGAAELPYPSRCPVQSVGGDGDGIAILAAGDPQPRRHDFVIVATGFNVDARAISELAAFSDDIAYLGRPLHAATDLARSDLARHPYLGPGFELTERQAGRNPALARIHLVNHGATLSHTAIASDIPESTSQPNGCRPRSPPRCFATIST